MATEIQGVYASYDLLTPEKARALWDEGYRVFSQQLWTAAEQPANRVINLRAAYEQGFKLVGPIATNSSRPGGWHVWQARAGVPDDLWAALLLTPIDVELENIPNTDVRNAVETARDFGKRRCLYYSTHTWVDYQGNPDGFADCMTYFARYDGVAALPGSAVLPPSMRSSAIVGKQYTNTLITGNLETCREVWNQELLIGAPVPVPVPAPTLESLDASVKFLSSVVVNLAARVRALEGGS